MAETFPITVRRTAEFSRWLKSLRDARSRQVIQSRLFRLEEGNFGDAKSVGGGISELRIDHGPGFRLYYTKIGSLVVLLLCAGDKSSQTRDIERAKRLAAEYEGGHR